MTVFELVRQEVTSKQAAELYGLRIDRAGRGFCPWHDDGEHAALQFFGDGGCYCHSCHKSGDAVDITAKMLGLPMKEAAERLRKDFHLDTPTDDRPDPSTKFRAKQRQEAKAAFNKRWGYLCDVVREADARLAQYTPETADTTFDVILAARCKADQELNLMWEEMRNGRSRRVHTN